MECNVCGAATDSDSVYCQKCGKRIGEMGISQKEILGFLNEKKQSLDMPEMEQNVLMLINKVREHKFTKVEIHRSSLEGMDFTDFFGEIGGCLYVKCSKPKEYFQLAAALFINEIDSLHNELLMIDDNFHNDRMAKISAAERHYERAMQTKDGSQRVQELAQASEKCVLGLEELKNEMRSNLDLFANLPKSALKKLFCGISIGAAEQALKEMQEAFLGYCKGVAYLIGVDIQREEQERAYGNIEKEWEFLKEIKNSAGYRSLLEVDEENANKWEENVNCLEVGMYYIKKNIDSDTIVVKIMEGQE